MPNIQNVETNQRKNKTIRINHGESGMSSNFSVNGSKAPEEQDLPRTLQDHSYGQHATGISEAKLDQELEGSHGTSAQISESILQKKCISNGLDGELTSKERRDWKQIWKRLFFGKSMCRLCAEEAFSS